MRADLQRLKRDTDSDEQRSQVRLQCGRIRLSSATADASIELCLLSSVRELVKVPVAARQEALEDSGSRCWLLVAAALAGGLYFRSRQPATR